MTEKKEWKQENDKILIINVTNKKNYSTENARQIIRRQYSKKALFNLKHFCRAEITNLNIFNLY